MNFAEMHLHDSEIRDIFVENDEIVFVIPFYQFNNVTHELRLRFETEVDSVDIRYIKQFHRNHRVMMKGQECFIDDLKKIFDKGYALAINDVFSEIDSDTWLFACDLIPYDQRKGVYHKFFLELSEVKSISVN